MRAVCGARADVRLTAEQQKVLLTEYGVYANEACDPRHKILPEVRWTRKDMPETYCSRTWAAGKGNPDGRIAQAD
jgi:hypothetical protein